MGGDENSFFNGYDNGAIKNEAERLGFFIVCPKGRGPTSMYRGDAERDVVDVLADVRQAFKIDGARVYLMGHSMGAYGTWSVAANHPELFAALGPISGGGNPAALAKIKHVPQYVVHGDADPTVPVTQSRAMVQAAGKLGMKTVYREVPGGKHGDVVVPSFAPMFDFFAQQARAVLP
jgi:predicted peptidase